MDTTEGAVMEPPAPEIPAEHLDVSPRLAGFWRRALAFLVDALIVVPASYLLLDTVARAFQSTFPDNYYSMQGNMTLLMVGAEIAALWLYTALFESGEDGGTPGKMLLGIRVVGPGGNAPGFGRASLRFAGKVISTLILGIGYFMAAGRGKRALHDRIAGTRVER